MSEAGRHGLILLIQELKGASCQAQSGAGDGKGCWVLCSTRVEASSLKGEEHCNRIFPTQTLPSNQVFHLHLRAAPAPHRGHPPGPQEASSQQDSLWANDRAFGQRIRQVTVGLQLRGLDSCILISFCV